MPGSGLTVSVGVTLVFATMCVHFGAGLLMEDSSTTASRLDALEKLLAEEKQTRMNLTAMLNEEQRLRTQLTQDLDAAKQRLSHLEAHPTNSGYPAFMAVLSATVDQCTADQHVIFDGVKYNEGGAYNNHHGVFTAPIAGTYLFTSTLSGSPNTYFNIAIVRNDEEGVIAYMYSADTDIWLERSTTTIIHLDENDEIWMKCRGDSQIMGTFYHSYLAGVLISPDA